MSAFPLSPVSVPFCRLPGSLVQTFDPATCLRSAFQVNFLVSVADRPDFAYFVTLTDRGSQYVMPAEFAGPFSVMWYDRAGRCHADRVGANRVLESQVFSKTQQTAPAPLNGPVYRSRLTSVAMATIDGVDA
jgi:hypothetical protein